MTIIERNNTNSIFHKICIIMIWLTAMYSSIFQFVLIQIPYGMLLLGIAILASYILKHFDKPFDFFEEMTIESIYMIVFLIYMLVFGCVFAIDKSNHISQWITCLEYLILLIIISSIIKHSGTDTFYYLLFIEAIILAFIFIRNPVDYQGRYSISLEVNPNGLGMSFAAGIWAVLYIYHKKKTPLIIVAIITVFLIYCILMTGSRKSLIATGLTLGIWLFFCFFPTMKKKGGYKSFFSIILMIVLVSLAAKILINQYADSVIANRMDELSYETSEGERSNMYRVGYQFFQSNPLFGIGFQGYAYLYGSYSHATLVEIPVSGGIVGTLLYFGIYILSIKRVFHVYTITRGQEKYEYEHMRIKMIIILWIVMLFYTSCVIHLYQFESFVLFSLIFGDTAFIEKKIESEVILLERKKTGRKYIRYE